jgi:tetratricopeptide (TPR) repeat protein
MGVVASLPWAVAGVVLAVSPAFAAVVSVGSSAAEQCYEAVVQDRAAATALPICNQAVDEALSTRERVATLVNRGIVRMKADNVAGAIADYDHAIRLDPDEPEAFLNKGVELLRDEQRWQAALPLFEAALSRNTRRPALAYFGRAVVREGEGNIEAAYRDYRRAADLAPTWDQPRRELSRFRTVRKKSLRG